MRATMPETDPSSAGTLSRLERLERLANLDPGAVVPEASVAGPSWPGTRRAERSDHVDSPRRKHAGAPMSPPRRPRPEDSAREGITHGRGPRRGGTDPPGSRAVEVEPEGPHAADAGSVDVAMLRRSWPSLLDHLSQAGQPESARSSRARHRRRSTARRSSSRSRRRSGTTCALPAARTSRTLLGDLFGIRPRIESVTREPHVGGTEPAAAAYVDEEQEPSEEEALRRLKEVLGATPADDGDAEG